ncbi:putative 4-hydroxythreonine-4-phosphate dehydrogenase [Magnetofaba australis IT-1]|uniref:Putative 4-hydroxythreonine-4-phosphate dehydrogenase n=2 Tax=Magnetofaba TaxID=1472292 RepID=A0A1Y2K6H9_9PROT|nr:putative 4-hydroxythreonine-4-phosphate dehydrogenase [Magnetofaba australis IT-1]
MGDPAGVGPELVLKAFVARSTDAPRWVWLGDPEVLAWAARAVGLPCSLAVLSDVREAQGLDPKALPVLPTTHKVDRDHLHFGVAHGGHAQAVVESIRMACDLAMGGLVDGVATPPINKSALHLGGFDIPGHTELLGQFTHSATPPVMMLAGRGLRVIPATIHQSLASVPQALTVEGLAQTLVTTAVALAQDFSLPHPPHIAVTGLNPHAGEAGAFGDEESRIIEPAMALASTMLQSTGLISRWEMTGPWPADSLFSERSRSRYDAIVCMYHDQALIPIKMLAFGEAVNITLGLPIVRASVDHGTAYDLAGRGAADHRSLLIAIESAAQMAASRRMWRAQHGEAAHA